ncbi:MAG TPA: hypothetical protein VLF21_01400 [Candidatus Saccharimonadales bacterium]|nr:hypothetical protein [Candidatus Saccharimonadales bacterium]
MPKTPTQLDELTSLLKDLERTCGTLLANRHHQLESIRRKHQEAAAQALKAVDAKLEEMTDWKYYFTLETARPEQRSLEGSGDFLKRVVVWYKDGIARARRGTESKKQTA